MTIQAIFVADTEGLVFFLFKGICGLFSYCTEAVKTMYFIAYAIVRIMTMQC